MIKFQIEKEPMPPTGHPKNTESQQIVTMKRSTCYLNWAVVLCVLGGALIDANLIGTGSCLEIVAGALMIIYICHCVNGE